MQHETPVAYSLGRQSQLWVEIGAVYSVSCKPQPCQKQKDNYSTANKTTFERFEPFKHKQIQINLSILKKKKN